MKVLKFALVLVLIFQSMAFAADSISVINSFAFNAAKIIAESNNNFFFSPYSIINAFGMLYSGARGSTASEIEKALNFSPEFHKNFRLIAENIDSEIFKSANRVWIQKNITLNQEYTNLLAENYSGSVYQLDFEKSLDSSRKFINNWVSKETKGRIKNLLQQLAPDTLMILTNAVYFNAEWLDPFDSKFTNLKPFNVPGLRHFNVPMMQKVAKFQYGENNGMKIIRLPYKNGNISMLVILPEENKTGLESLNHAILANMIKNMKNFRVDLWLPKFKTENNFNLNDLFMSLGVKIAFTNNADFSGITQDEGLKIDAIIHKTFIEVDEKKTEAAAATAITMVRTTAIRPENPKIFHADRPFLYFIIDNETGVILFMGRQTFNK